MSMLFKRFKDWATSITAFRTGDVIPVDGPSGTAKMSKDDLLKETAENAVDSRLNHEKILETIGSSIFYHNYQNGYLNAGGQFVAGDASVTCTDYIEVSEGFVLHYEGKGFGSNTYPILFGYSDNVGSDAVAILTDISSNFDKMVIVPSGVNYVRAWAWKQDVSLSVIGSQQVGKNFKGVYAVCCGMDGEKVLDLDSILPSESDEDVYALYKGEKYSLKNALLKADPFISVFGGPVRGYLKADGTFAGTPLSTDNYCTDYIAVSEGQKIEYTGKGFAASSSFSLIVGYTDNLGGGATIIQSDNTSTTVTKNYVIGSGINYIRACSMNQQPLTLRIGNYKPEVIVDKSGRGDTDDVAEALMFAFDTSAHPVTIKVLAGVYDMPKILYGQNYASANRHLAIIGEDKTNTIIRNRYGYYSTSWPNYDCACLRLAGNLYIANLTFISSDELFSEDPQYDVAYCLHLDFACDGGICEVNNCRLVNTHGGSAIGFGTRNNYEIKIVDCDIECQQTTGHGAVYGHNGNEVSPTGQKFTLVRNRIKGLDAKAVSVEYAYSNNAVIDIKCIGNAIFGTDGNSAFAKYSTFILDSESCLNNITSANA